MLKPTNEDELGMIVGELIEVYADKENISAIQQTFAELKAQEKILPQIKASSMQVYRASPGRSQR